MPFNKHLEGQAHIDTKEEKEWDFMPACPGGIDSLPKTLFHAIW